MTTRALEEMDRGLGSCLAGEDLTTLEEPCPGRPQEDKAPVKPRLADSSWPHDPQEPVAAGAVDARPPKMEKEPAARAAPGPGKEKLKAGTTPRSAPGRRKAQASPPPQPPPPPPAPSEELPWGDVTLNKCLVLASLVALLGSALQLCRDAVAGDAAVPAPAPEPWVPPSSPLKKPVSPASKPAAGTPLPGPPAPQMRPPTGPAEAEDRPEVPRSREAEDNAQRVPGETPGEERAPLADRGPQERPRKEKPRKEVNPRKEERPRKEKTRKEERPRKERPRAARENREALPRRWEAREGGHRPWSRDSRDPEHRKRQAWVSPRRRDGDDGPLGQQKRSAGKGRD